MLSERGVETLLTKTGVEDIVGSIVWYNMTNIHHHVYTSWGYQLTNTGQNGGPRAISEFLHIEYRIVCCIETYLIHIYHMSKCSKCN